MEEREIKEAITFCHELKSRIELAKQRGRDILYQLMGAGKRPKREWCALFELPQEDWPEYLQDVEREKESKLGNIKSHGLPDTEIKTALPGYYTATEAAERLGYRDGSYLSRMCAQGRIMAYKVGSVWLIPEQWVTKQLQISPKGPGARGISRK